MTTNHVTRVCEHVSDLGVACEQPMASYSAPTGYRCAEHETTHLLVTQLQVRLAASLLTPESFAYAQDAAVACRAAGLTVEALRRGWVQRASELLRNLGGDGRWRPCPACGALEGQEHEPACDIGQLLALRGDAASTPTEEVR